MNIGAWIIVIVLLTSWAIGLVEGNRKDQKIDPNLMKLHKALKIVLTIFLLGDILAWTIFIEYPIASVVSKGALTFISIAFMALYIRKQKRSKKGIVLSFLLFLINGPVYFGYLIVQALTG